MKNEEEEFGVLFITKQGNIIGGCNDDRLSKLVWYKRLFAKFSKNYRNKHIYIKPFKCEIK